MAMPADGWPSQVLRDLQVDKPGEAASLLMGHPQGEHLLLECRAVLAQGKVRQARELKAQLERLISAEAQEHGGSAGASAASELEQGQLKRALEHALASMVDHMLRKREHVMESITLMWTDTRHQLAKIHDMRCVGCETR